jgi:hypothetical protein
LCMRIAEEEEEWRIASWRRRALLGKEEKKRSEGAAGKEREGEGKGRRAWRREVGVTCHLFSKFFFKKKNQTALHRACSRAAVRRPGRHGPWN